MDKNSCPHTQSTYVRDIILIGLFILIIFIFREFISWFFKTNHTHSIAQQNNNMLHNIESVLQRNGLV